MRLDTHLCFPCTLLSALPVLTRACGHCASRSHLLDQAPELLPLLASPPNAPAGDSDLLNALLSYHLIPGAVLTAAQLRTGQMLPTALEGYSLRVLNIEGHVRLFGVGSEAVVTAADIPVCGGIVHIVDTVLVPVPSEAALAPAPGAYMMMGGGAAAAPAPAMMLQQLAAGGA